MKRFLFLLLCLTLLFSFATAEPTADYPVVTVNGEDLLYSQYLPIESTYLYQYEAAGLDMTDPEIVAYLQDLALTYAIEQLLVTQDMEAQGCYNLDAETEAWCAQNGKETYEKALSDVMALFRSAETTEDEVLTYALAYAASLGVTEETYVDFYRTQFALINYYDWLIRDNPVTDEAVKTAYDERVAASKAKYEADVAAFETALSSNAEIWYRPSGYRSVLQILLPAQGETAEEKITSVQSIVDDIYARLESGERFESLIRDYGQDTAFDDEAFFSTGYQVHQDSIIWEEAFVSAAFSAEMAQPGCWSQPFASDLGVHILYYLADVPGGAIALTDETHEALSYVIYTERHTEAQTQRIQELADAAEIVIH